MGGDGGFQFNPAYADEIIILDDCVGNVLVIGPLWEQVFARVLQWFTVILSAAFLVYYVYSTFKATCGWEELYVCSVEFMKVVVEVYLEYTPPFMIYQTNGQITTWLRYMEWLLTCPVILIHLSNITGLNDEYSGRTMSLITSDLGGITFAVTSAVSVGWPKALFFMIGCCYGASTFYHAACIYIESYHMMPEGKCKRLVVYMCGVFFSSWFMFPGLFLSGPEGFKALSWSGTTIAHTVADLLSKNIWGLVGHNLRVAIHEHILINGDVRRPLTVNVFGTEQTLNCFVMNDDEEDDQRISTKEYANRQSFVKMKENMKERGIDTRKSMEFANVPPPKVRDGSIIVAVTDQSILSFFQQEVDRLDATIRIVSCMGMQQLDEALQKGADGLLLAPDYLQQPGIVQHIKSKYGGIGIFAYGWGKTSPNRGVIESSGVDGWLEGPAFGSNWDAEKFEEAIGTMQDKKAPPQLFGGLGAMPGMGGGIPSGMNPSAAMGMGMMGAVSPAGMSPGQMSPMASGMQTPPALTDTLAQQAQMMQQMQQMQQMMQQMQQMTPMSPTGQMNPMQSGFQ